MAAGVGMGLIMSCSLVLFAESADEYALVKRQTRTGLLLGLLPLGNKSASSIGKQMAGIALQVVALPVGVRAETVSSHSLRALGTVTVGFTACAGLLALFFFSRYYLPRQRYAEIVEGLNSPAR